MSGIARNPRRWRRASAGLGVAAAVAVGITFGVGSASTATAAAAGVTPSTPIQHLVVIFDENISFDHYFGTYPNAANTDGVPFTAKSGTPTDANSFTNAGLAGAANPSRTPPFRLTPDQALTCDQNHGYGPEQKAANDNQNDMYPQATSTDTCTGLYGRTDLVMGYYDGNTVPALWNYAQNYALSDETFGTTFGPSTPGALNLISGQTWGVSSYDPSQSEPGKVVKTADPDSYTVVSPDANGVGTVINDPDPVYDDCSDKDHTSKNALGAMSGQNIGDLLNQKNVTWGWFQGGFTPSTAWDGTSGDFAKCGGTTHTTVALGTGATPAGATSVDYSPHHSPFQYYASTANPHHLPPTSVAAIGSTDQANHQYDLTDFDRALGAGNLPAVSFLKAPEYQDGHAAYSDPVDEQNFLIDQINQIEKSPQWASTAVVVTYDDTDGWYDHATIPVANGSNDPKQDASICTSAVATKGIQGNWSDRCGPGPRIPMLAISPYAKSNAIVHTPFEQASIIRFVEDNWQTGQLPAPAAASGAQLAATGGSPGGSFDARATPITSLFDLSTPKAPTVQLAADGTVASVTGPPAAVPTTPVSQLPGLPGAPNSSTGSSSPPLAATGVRIGVPLAAGLLLVGAGTAIYLSARRRREQG